MNAEHHSWGPSQKENGDWFRVCTKCGLQKKNTPYVTTKGAHRRVDYYLVNTRWIMRRPLCNNGRSPLEVVRDNLLQKSSIIKGWATRGKSNSGPLTQDQIDLLQNAAYFCTEAANKLSLVLNKNFSRST
jgi:hypothetical protein